MLIDALPPFDGGVIPGIDETQPMGYLSFRTGAGLDCGETAIVAADDGVNGNGKVPVRNLLSIDNLPYATSVRPIEIVADLCHSVGALGEVAVEPVHEDDRLARVGTTCHQRRA